MTYTFLASLRGDRHVKPAEKLYRLLTTDECRALEVGRRAAVVDDRGRIAEAKVTKVKTWKKGPNVEVHWKYGMYEFGTETITPNLPNSFFVAEVTDAKGN